MLNENQMEAVMTEGPLLIIAGAGSGKTTTLAERTAHLSSKGTILLLSFTNKAAQELKERAAAICSDDCRNVTACTYHSFCAKVLRRYAKEVGFDNHFTILDMKDAEDVASLAKTALGYEKESDFKPKKLAEVFSLMKNTGISLKAALKKKNMGGFGPGKIKKIENILAESEKYKKEHNMMDFDDLLIYTIKLFKTCEYARRKVEEDYRYIMVDEYQDSNTLQEELLFLIRKENHELCVVGDDAQSIYGFRGSRVENIREFENKMPGCKKITLDDNYRSNQEILDLSNNVMDLNDKKGIKKNLRAARGESNIKPCFIRVWNEYEEAEKCAKRIEKMLENGEEDICVLYRAAMQSHYLEGELVKRGILYEKRGGIKFFDKAHIKDILSYLRCISNTDDELAYYRVFRSMKGIGERKAKNYISQMKNGEKPHDTFKAASESLRRFHIFMEEAASMSFPEILELVEEQYIKEEKIKITTSAKRNQKEELQELKERQEDFKVLNKMGENYTSLQDFLENITLGALEEDKEKKKVILSTIHSAKGLEFHAVIILGCSDGVFPRAEEGSDEDDEELRCFYVAVTRAKDNLILYGRYANSRYLNGSYKFTNVVE